MSHKTCPMSVKRHAAGTRYYPLGDYFFMLEICDVSFTEQDNTKVL